ncbi:MAG TPA: hypothetical protein VMW73_13375 [Spirochaetia bacterium]|nr:hypothetical protein [Spirochaetia bacterium]
MQIVINDEPISYTLENERTLGQVVAEIEKWLAGQRLAVSAVRSDENELPLYAPERWTSVSVDGVGTLHVTASTFREMKLATLETMRQYLTLMQSGIETRRDIQLKELLDEYPYIRDSLNELVGVGNGSQASSALDALIETSGLLDGAIKDDETRTALARHIDDLKLIIVDRSREATQPRREAASTAVLLQQSIPEISEVSVLLQTGKDQQAMASVVRFTELLGKVVRIVPYLAESNPDLIAGDGSDRSLPEIASELNGFLHELISAFDAKDSVLIGDLLEYEIAPRVQEIAQLFAA